MKTSILAVLAALFAAVDARPLQYTFSTLLDHVTGGANSTKFNMRYIVDDQYFKNTTSGKLRPIFFYCGNEGSVWDFYENSGFMTTTLAEQFGALVVFGEHRYFGESFPFPKDIAFKEGYNSYLTVENTMMDYVELIKMIKTKYGA